jgi:hypothetical protein
MNKAFDQLMVKAGAYFGGEGIDYSNFDPKKFAELIVRECIDVVEDAGGIDKYHYTGAIGKHFGVEE